MTQQRDFKGVWIPKAVWLDDRLTALDKIILVEIDSLDNGERGCFASNKYIADFCQCSETKVSKSISDLIKYGYLFVQSFDGRQRELKSRLTENAKQPCKKYKADKQKIQESNTSNNTDINKKKERKQGSFDKLIYEYIKSFSVAEGAEIMDLLFEWLKVRKAKRAAMTDRAIQMNIDKLDSLAKQSGMSVTDYLKEIICRGWAAFYVINNYSNGKPAPAKVGANGIAISSEASELDGVF